MKLFDSILGMGRRSAPAQQAAPPPQIAPTPAAGSTFAADEAEREARRRELSGEAAGDAELERQRREAEQNDPVRAAAIAAKRERRAKLHHTQRPQVFLSPPLLLTVAKRANAAGFELATAKERETLKAAEVHYAAAWETMVSHTREAADRDWTAQSKALSDALAAGDLDAIRANPGWTREDILEDYLAKCSAAKRQQRLITEAIRPIVAAVAARLGEFAGQLADEMEARDKADYAAWGLDYVPSRVAVELRKIQEFNQGLVPGDGVSVRPSTILGFAGIQL